MTYTDKQLKDAFVDYTGEFETPDDFRNFLAFVDAQIEKAVSESKSLVDVLDTLESEGQNVEQLLRKVVKYSSGEIFEGMDIDDSGEETDAYYIVDNVLYKLRVSCDADWCGDWSVRANLPTDSKILSMNIIDSYEVTKKY